MKFISSMMAIGLSAALAGCGGGSDTSSSGLPPPNTTTAVPATVQATQSGYSITVFATAPGSLRPDDLLQLGSSIFAVYQDNNINPDGTLAAGVTSAQAVVVQYDLSGNVQHTYNVPGHPDGIMAYDSNTVWVSSNEDANAELTVINVGAGTLRTYTDDVAPNQLAHGGGLDDMKLVNGVVYASASNPTTSGPVTGTTYSTDASGATAQYGVSTSPAVYSLTLNANGTTFHATPTFSSGVTANMGGGTTTLNMTDPDSMAIDPNGNLVVDSQQDSELVTVSNIGKANQSISVVPLTLYGNPWPVDDTRWSLPSGASFMLVSDNKAQLIYRIDAKSGFPASTAYSAGQGTVVQTDTKSGFLTPIFVGMNTPHGLIFVTTP